MKLLACLAVASLLGTPMASHAARVDLALGKAVTGSSICKPGEEAVKAVNGKLASKTQDKFCTKDVPSWLRIDLGQVSKVSGFTIRHAGAGDEPMEMNTRAFTVRVSTDGTDWKSVVDVTANTASVTEHRITPVQARYVELDVTKPTQTDDPATRIYEVEVW
ncbi:discoidin domain-containing protein [Luteibacter aegosomaticola]|uniref:discoidin domain-containing protein n=1 Tax=Luteibacter aegosomaticola TaxID=2911538 RepID=UPI001FFA35F8|nr:discoidin domain-containing protein [Luteibacter aegosomaticola]UPG89862.1 discoidin domain-containing protein [Luteibacter aegosomaticola]